MISATAFDLTPNYVPTLIRELSKFPVSKFFVLVHLQPVYNQRGRYLPIQQKFAHYKPRIIRGLQKSEEFYNVFNVRSLVTTPKEAE